MWQRAQGWATEAWRRSRQSGQDESVLEGGEPQKRTRRIVWRKGRPVFTEVAAADAAPRAPRKNQRKALCMVFEERENLEAFFREVSRGEDTLSAKEFAEVMRDLRIYPGPRARRKPDRPLHVRRSGHRGPQ